MSAAGKDNSERKAQLEQVVAAYREAVRTGQNPDRKEWLARYPHLAFELEAALAAMGPDGDRAELGDNRRADPPTLPSDIATLAQVQPGAGAASITETVIGDYELLEEVARGGMGVVFRARQVSLNRIVALKMILAGQLASAADVQRFRTEAEAAANLDHPNIVPIYEVGEHSGRPFFTMKFVEGGSLAELQRETPELMTARGRQWAAQLVATVARAVHHAHQRGILHRDLKPGNILLQVDDGRRTHQGKPAGTPSRETHSLRVAAPGTLHAVSHIAMVTDFGVAKKVQADRHITQSGAIVGTPSYMAPEQAAGKRSITTAVDIYSLGAVLYDLLTGRPPFHADSPLDTLLQVMEREPQSPRAIKAEIDRDLETIALKCLEKDPARRYHSAEELADDLDRWLQHEPIVARPATALEKVRKWVRRRPAVAALFASLAVVLIAGVASVTALWLQADNARTMALAHAEAEREQRTRAVESERQAREALAAEELARQAEKTHRDIAEDALRRAQTSLYFNRINLAQQYWNTDNIAQADRILEETPATQRDWEWHYLKRLCHADVATLPGNGQFTQAMRFTPDGRLMAAVATTGNSGVRIWDMATLRMVSEINQFGSGHLHAFSDGAISPDGKQVALGDRAGHVTLWDVLSRKRQRDLAHMPARVASLSYSPDGKYLACAWSDERSGSTILPFLNTPRRESVQVLEIATGKVVLNRQDCGLAATFSPDGRYLLTFKKNPVLRLSYNVPEHIVILIDAATWKECRDLGSARSWSFRADGLELILGGWDERQASSIRIVEPGTGKVSLQLALPYGAGDIDLSPDGQHFAVAKSYQSTVDIWSVKKQQPVRTLRGHKGVMNGIAFTPDGSRLATSNWDNTIKLWDHTKDQVAQRLPGRAASYASATQIAPDGRRVAWVQGDNVITGFFPRGTDPLVRIWDAPSGKLLHTLKGHKEGARRVAFSGNGRFVISGGRDAMVHVWEADSGRHVSSFSGHSGYIEGVAISHDGQWGASTHEPPEAARLRFGGGVQNLSIPGSIKVWDARTGKERYTIKNLDDIVWHLAISPDGSILASAGYKDLRLWSLPSGGELKRFKAGRTSALTFSPDGSLLAAAGADGITLWDVKTSKLLQSLRGHGRGLFGGISFSPNGRRLVSAVNAEVKLWDVASGLEVLTLQTTDGNDTSERVGIRALAFSPDGRRILAAMMDTTVRAWDAAPLMADAGAK